MTMTMNGPAVRAPTSSSDNDTAAAEQLRANMTAVRLSISWLGVRKTLTRDQKQEAAEAFGAEGNYLSAAKKLLDTRHPAYKAVTAVKGQAASYWKGMTLPYPDPGIRLLRHSDVEAFNAHMELLREQLDEAVAQLDEHYADLKAAARDWLGRLFDDADYPPTLTGMFAIEWDFPSVEPPRYLRQLCPEVWQRECQRVAQRFDEAVQLAEQAFLEEFGKLVSHITERLAGVDDDGKPKVFRDSAVSNLSEFFDRFRHLNVHSSAQLDELVDRAQGAVKGVAAQELRDSTALRDRVARQLGSVQKSLDELMVDKPRRRILRSRRQGEGES